MATVASAAGTIVIQDDRYAGNRSLPYAGRQMLVPVLLGLGIPGVAVGVFAPNLLSNSNLVFGFYLMAIFVVAAVIFIRSIFNPGTLVEATFDTKTRLATFVRLGSFASSTMVVPFGEIAKVYIETQYDDDGYKTFTPVIELRNGEALSLPEGTAQRQIEGIRTLVGC